MVMDLYEALEKSALDSIQETMLDIGVLRKCREKFKGNEAIDHKSNLLLLMAKWEIEEAYESITEWRKAGAIFRAGQSDISSRNGSDVQGEGPIHDQRDVGNSLP